MLVTPQDGFQWGARQSTSEPMESPSLYLQYGQVSKVSSGSNKLHTSVGSEYEILLQNVENTSFQKWAEKMRAVFPFSVRATARGTCGTGGYPPFP